MGYVLTLPPLNAFVSSFIGARVFICVLLVCIWQMRPRGSVRRPRVEPRRARVEQPGERREGRGGCSVWVVVFDFGCISLALRYPGHLSHDYLTADNRRVWALHHAGQWRGVGYGVSSEVLVELALSVDRRFIQGCEVSLLSVYYLCLTSLSVVGAATWSARLCTRRPTARRSPSS